MGKKLSNPIPYTPDQIRELIKHQPNRLYHEIENNNWMDIEFLKHINMDGMETIYLLRSFYNRVKPRQKIDSNGQTKLL